MSDFDTMLWRPLRSGNEYDALFPVTSCKSTYVGDGNTDFSIDEMEKVIDQYAFQTEKVAQKLLEPTLNGTTDKIHDFLFNHFQYLADESNQLLRSPACSWFTRKKGIDCKSYSILASCILLNLDIAHYIRKIKQPGYAPEEYTHVYVVVPRDQNTGSLESGYYVIDGTLKSNTEPAFIGKSDLQMSELKHYSLNGAAGLNGGISISTLKNLSKQVSLNNLKSIFSSIDCIGGSSLTESGIKTYLGNIDTYYQDWQVKFNTAIQNKDFETLSMLVAEFYANGFVFYNASVKNKAKGWNSCTSARINAAIKAFSFYVNVVGQLVTVYMDEYFVRTGSTGASYFSTSEGMEKKYGFRHLNLNTPITKSMPSYQVKSRGGSVPAFEIPQYVIDQSNTGGQLNLDTFLDLIETTGNVLIAASPSGNNLNNGGGYVNGNGNIKDLNPNKTSNAGMGWLVGGAIGIFGLAMVFGKMKDKPTKEAK